MPANPDKVRGFAPSFKAMREISTRPRVISAALPLLPYPRPSLHEGNPIVSQYALFDGTAWAFHSLSGLARLCRRSSFALWGYDCEGYYPIHKSQTQMYCQYIT